MNDLTQLLPLCYRNAPLHTTAGERCKQAITAIPGVQLVCHSLFCMLWHPRCPYSHGTPAQSCLETAAAIRAGLLQVGAAIFTGTVQPGLPIAPQTVLPAE